VDEYRDGKFNAFVEQLKAAATIEEQGGCGEGCGCH